MTDSILRALERDHTADPSDPLKKDALLRARVRAGLGWHGERRPKWTICKLDERLT